MMSSALVAPSSARHAAGPRGCMCSRPAPPQSHLSTVVLARAHQHQQQQQDQQRQAAAVGTPASRALTSAVAIATTAAAAAAAATIAAAPALAADAAAALADAPATTAAATAAAAATTTATSAYVPSPLQVPEWQIWFGAAAGAFPFVIGAYEFTKRILIQRRCKACGGSGLVMRGPPGKQLQRKCLECGGFFPWRGWSEFLSATAQPGNGGPLLAPRGQTSVFYSVPPKTNPPSKEVEGEGQQQQQALARRQRQNDQWDERRGQGEAEEKAP